MNTKKVIGTVLVRAHTRPATKPRSSPSPPAVGIRGRFVCEEGAQDPNFVSGYRSRDLVLGAFDRVSIR